MTISFDPISLDPISRALDHVRTCLGFGRQLGPPFGRVLLAKTTLLGDLVISLPMASALKQRDPRCTVIFLTNKATQDVARCCPDVDEVLAEPPSAEALRFLLRALRIDIFIQINPSRVLAQAAYEADIPVRIGKLFRTHNWRRCTRLVAQSSSLRGLNKRLLDLQYLRPLGIHVDSPAALRDLVRLSPPAADVAAHPSHFAGARRTIVLCPALITAKSHQWPLTYYSRLIRTLDATGFHWFICGTAADRAQLQPLLRDHLGEANVTDLVGQFSLLDFTRFIRACNGLVAGSTGPLHLAAALGIHTLGLFQSRKVDLQRWHPVGPLAAVLSSKVRCRGERRTEGGNMPIPCPCIAAIDPHEVAQQVLGWFDLAGSQRETRQAAATVWRYNRAAH
jgi:heptosyltransferase-3